MKLLSRKRCYQVGKGHRWEYWKIVVRYLKIINPKSTLELGASVQPIVLDGDTITKNKIEKPTYLWNAIDIPWPIKKKQYDVFIALQVWEHLKGNQIKVFKEVPRISNIAILSFPYKWPGNSSHSKINKSKIREWTKPYEPFLKPKIVRSRIIYLFNFSGKINKDIKIRLEEI